MGDALAKAGGLGIFVIVVDGVLIARQLREAPKVGIGQRLGRDSKGVADLKIFQIFGRRCHGSLGLSSERREATEKGGVCDSLCRLPLRGKGESQCLSSSTAIASISIKASGRISSLTTIPVAAGKPLRKYARRTSAVPL